MDTLKKKSFGYSERNEEDRKKFIKKLNKLKAKSIAYIDESGIDNNDVKNTGWARIGKKLFDMKMGNRTRRISFISALNSKNLIASFIFEGACTREVYETYLKQVLVPKLSPGQLIVMDNASIHKGGTIEEIIKGAGCELMYLPTYSPDLNPIENCWAVIK